MIKPRIPSTNQAPYLCNEKKVAMKIIFHTWRTYKSELVKIWWDQETPFDKYKDLIKEDWLRFVEKCELKHYGTNSQYTQWL
jgi:hypothetical protein